MVVIDSGHPPDIGAVIAPRDMSESCPYVEGYCGEHIHDYPDVIQKAGRLKIPRICRFYSLFSVYFAPNFPDPILDNPAGAASESANERRRNAMDRDARALAAAVAMRVAAHRPISSSTTRVRRRPAQANAIAGPSTLPQAPAGQSHTIPTQAEIELLTRLANGNGLSSHDTAGFLRDVIPVAILFLVVFFVVILY